MKYFSKIVFSLFVFSNTFTSQAQQVSTFEIAGTPQTFNHPNGIVYDSDGNLFVVEVGSSDIIKVTPDGTVSTFAGTSSTGSANGSGTNASFYSPVGLTIDMQNNLYVADGFNNRIRKITPAGVVSTFAGSTIGYTNGTGTAALFNNPHGVAIDNAGNLYVADCDNNVIRKITVDGEVTTLAGSGAEGSADGTGTAASFRHPNGLGVDQAGNVYVADTYNYKIRKITPQGVVSTIAGTGFNGKSDGIGTAASFYYPNNVCVDDLNYLYVSDTKNSLIRKISPDGEVTTFAGSGTLMSTDGYGTAASFFSPNAIIFDANGDLVVADTYGNLIRKIFIENKITAVSDKNVVSEVLIYPTPALNYFTITCNISNSENVKIELINVSGSIVLTNEVSSSNGYNKITISTDQLPSGLYIANLYVRGATISRKIIIGK